jgi:hypothetical protein
VRGAHDHARPVPHRRRCPLRDLHFPHLIQSQYQYRTLHY